MAQQDHEIDVLHKEVEAKQALIDEHKETQLAYEQVGCWTDAREG